MPTVETRTLRGRQVEALRRQQHVQRLIDLGLVEQWLTHAHEDDIANRPAFGAKLAVGLDDLIEDLIAGQIQGHAHLPRRTESAANGAADLARHAQGGSAGSDAEDDAFDQLAAGRPEQELAGPIELRIVSAASVNE